MKNFPVIVDGVEHWISPSVATVGINNGRNAGVLAGEILSIKNKNTILRAYNYPELDFNEVYKEYHEYAKELKKYVCDATTMLHKAIKKNENILCEGAQATLLDIDFGSYPFVTSSNPVGGGAATGSGYGPTVINEVIGVLPITFRLQ